METKHTPGPWKACEMGVIADTLSAHGNFYVCSLIDPDNEQDKANAHLIAAAPDMLEALKGFVMYWNDFERWPVGKGYSINDEAINVFKQARAAIAKAGGL